MDIPAAANRLPLHRNVLERAVVRFRDDERVVGLVLGGSLALGGADFYSDVDLYVIVRDEAFDAVFAERDEAAEAIGSPLLRFTVEPVPGGSSDYIVTYPGPVKLDLMYHRESEVVPGSKWKDRPVLKDDSGSLAAVVWGSAGSGPGRPAPEALAGLEQRFWTWCWYVFGKIVRGELWEALDGLRTIRSLALLPLLDWAAGTAPRRLQAPGAQAGSPDVGPSGSHGRTVAAGGTIRRAASRDYPVPRTEGYRLRPQRVDVRPGAGGYHRGRDKPALGRSWSLEARALALWTAATACGATR